MTFHVKCEVVSKFKNEFTPLGVVTYKESPLDETAMHYLQSGKHFLYSV